MTEPTPAVALVVDTDPVSGVQLADLLKGCGLRAVMAGDAATALQHFHMLRPVIVVLDLDLPDVPAPTLVRQFRNDNADVPVIVLGRKPEIGAAVRVTRAGATEFCDRATPLDELERAISGLLSSAATRRRAPLLAERAAVLADYPRFFRRSETMRSVERLVLEVAPVDAPVIILGEPGVGKEALARIIHHLSPRSGHPLVNINCTGMPDPVLDSELFGETATAGRPRKAGCVEQARGGSLVIAEISEMSPSVQAKTARLLRNGEYFRVRSSDLEMGEARVVATANKELYELVSRGEFRADLHEAFTWRIAVPPLRDRREEIPGLVRDYLDRFSRELGRERGELSASTLDLLAQYDWPGNVRELANVLKRRVVLDDENHLREEVRARIRVAQSRQSRPGPKTGLGAGWKPDAGLRTIARQAAQEAELAAIRQVLDSVDWNRAAAARRLKISYKTLLTKLSRGGLKPPHGPKSTRARK